MDDINLTKREGFLNVISKELGTVYCEDKEILKEKFALEEDNYLRFDQCNALLGNSDNYEYTICDFYYKLGRGGGIAWCDYFSIRLPEKDFPEFKLIHKSNFIKSSIPRILILLPVVLIFCVLLLFFLTSIVAIVINIGDTLKKLAENPFLIFGFFVMQLPLLFFYFLSSHFFVTMKIILSMCFSKNNFGINNQEFLSKYYFLEANDKAAIGRVFTSKVCDSILKFRPELHQIISKGNCLHIQTHNQVKSIFDCKKYVSSIINQAKIFEKDESF